MAPSVNQLGKAFLDGYKKNTTQKLKLIDLFLLFHVLTGIVQFVYCALVGTFPFNAFLSGFISTVGSFILTVCLRIQLNPKNEFTVTPERAFADFLFASLLLHLVVFNFIG
mmetsp:Transcript_2259/g.3751  ORF Transcript_2259/g.3751 Transcript_2259/m.3751 type:complete len:111 (-) Transcript_2259:15-347(-)